MNSSKKFLRSRMPRPLTAESSEELEEPSSSQLAHEDEKSPQKCMIKLDDIKIERENKKRDKEDEDYIESSQGSTSTETSMEEDDEDSVGSNEGATTPTARSQNGDGDIMDDEETDDEPRFQSSPASSQSTQRNSGGNLTTEQLLLLNRYDITPHDLKAIGRFLEHNGYSKDQKKVAMAVGWKIDSEGLKLVKNCIAQRGYEVHH